MTFCHLRLHSEYTLLNGMLRVPEIVECAKNWHMPSIALTDIGNVFGAVELFLAAQKKGVRPILGCEVILPSYDDRTQREFRRGRDSFWKLVLLAQNRDGYRNICQLLTEAYLTGFYYRPRIDTALLREHTSGLVVLSAGCDGEIAEHLHKGDEQAAEAALDKYQQIFGENFYIELNDNGLDFQPELNRALVDLAKRKGAPIVATANAHYLSPDDADAFEVLRGIQPSRLQETSLDAFKFRTAGYDLKSPEKMIELFADYPEAIANTGKIAESCAFEFDFKSYHFPKFETPPDRTLDQLLEDEARFGLDRRWPLIKLVSGKTDVDRPEYEARLRSELDCVFKMGFSGYYLIVSDFIRWAKRQGIPVGPGRGSAAGSLVAYCTEITDIDPIPYNLLFERFLNPERVSMPDVDVDFCQDRRPEVIEYVSKKYGNVSQIITFGKMKAKAVLRDVGRVMEQEYEFVDKIAKLVPAALNITLKEALEQEPRLQEMTEDDPTVKRLIETSLRLEGLSRHASTHAAGVVISDKPLTEFVPLYQGSNEDVVAQFDMKSIEKIGLIKFDFLGLKTLTVIANAVKMIEQTRGESVDISRLPLDDAEVFASLSRGEGCGVFQLESSGMRDLMTRLKPNRFEDIIALVALYRPGPMDLIPDFIARKHGQQAVEYIDPRLEEVLSPTYGIMVYQEQVMQIAQVIAGYTLGGADLLRRAMGKKNVEEMAKQREAFVVGAEKNGLPADKANHLFDVMEKFAGYGFNKSHAAAYALVAYQTAYLKTHFYPEYMAALMTSEMEDTDKILTFIDDCKQRGVTMLGPSINFSSWGFTVSEGKIRYGLGAIKGAGRAAIDSVSEARRDGEFKSFFDFCSRVDLRRVSKKVVEVLVKSGALDQFAVPRKALFDSIAGVTDSASRRQRDEARGQNDLFAALDTDRQAPIGVDFKITEDWSDSEKLSFEKEALGFYFSSHPLAPMARALTSLTSHTVRELARLAPETEVTLGGVITKHRVVTTKKGDRMAFASLEDLTGSVEIILFPKTYAKFRDLLESGDALLVTGGLDRTDEGVKILVEGLNRLSETLKTTTKTIKLEIPYSLLTPDKSGRLFEIFSRHPGESRVLMRLRDAGRFQAVLELPTTVSVEACEPLKSHVDRLFGGDVVRFN